MKIAQSIHTESDMRFPTCILLLSCFWRSFNVISHIINTYICCALLTQEIVRGSFIGHGDYIASAIAEMTKLSVTSSNSLRRTSVTLRKRAQSLGRLGELVEGETYQYQELNEKKQKNGQSLLGWPDWTRQVYSESGSPRPGAKKSATLQPNGLPPRAKSIIEVSTTSTAAPRLMPRDILGLQGAGQEGNYAHSEKLGLYNPSMALRSNKANQRPVSCLYNTPTLNQGSKVKPRVTPSSELPLVSLETPRRPYSTYDLKVRANIKVTSLKYYVNYKIFKKSDYRHFLLSLYYR